MLLFYFIAYEGVDLTTHIDVVDVTDLSDKIKRSFFFQAAVESILLYGCIAWTLTMRRKLDGNCTGMLRAVLSKSWRYYSTKQ